MNTSSRLGLYVGRTVTGSERFPHTLRETVSATYELEYGTDTLEMHTDALTTGQRVVIVDDLLATGGTAGACARLVECVGAKVVKMLFVIELEGFAARSGKLAGYEIESLIAYPGK